MAGDVRVSAVAREEREDVVAYAGLVSLRSAADAGVVPKCENGGAAGCGGRKRIVEPRELLLGRGGCVEVCSHCAAVSSVGRDQGCRV